LPEPEACGPEEEGGEGEGLGFEGELPTVAVAGPTETVIGEVPGTSVGDTETVIP
jgi:hypothetical protein